MSVGLDARINNLSPNAATKVFSEDENGIHPVPSREKTLQSLEEYRVGAVAKAEQMKQENDAKCREILRSIKEIEDKLTSQDPTEVQLSTPTPPPSVPKTDAKDQKHADSKSMCNSDPCGCSLM